MRRYLPFTLAFLAAVALVGAMSPLVGTVTSSAGTRGASRSVRRHTEISARSPHTSAIFAIRSTINRMRTTCRWRRFADGAIGADPKCAPGALAPSARGRVAQTICRPGWVAASSRLQSPASTKNRLLTEYSLPGNPTTYAIARVVPVEDGGSPTSSRNLYPLPLNGFGGERTRAAVAEGLHDEICSHQITLARAALTLEGDWLSHGLPDDD